MLTSNNIQILGPWITDHLNPNLQIRKRIERARTTLLSYSDSIITTKLRFVKCYVYNVLLYKVEAF